MFVLQKPVMRPGRGSGNGQNFSNGHNRNTIMGNQLPPTLGPPGLGPTGGGLTQKLRDCEIHATPASNKNWCQRWLKSFPTRSKRIDVISRIFFPLMFGLFNIVYWTTYTFREDLKSQ